MEINRVQEKYYKLPDESEFYKMSEISSIDVNIISVSKMGVIIYDTRISRDVVEEKFNMLKLAESDKEEFEEKYFEFKGMNK